MGMTTQGHSTHPGHLETNKNKNAKAIRKQKQVSWKKRVKRKLQIKKINIKEEGKSLGNQPSGPPPRCRPHLWKGNK